MTETRLPLDHVGVVVPDFTDGFGWYTEILGLRPVWRSKPLDVADGAIMGLPGDKVRLEGVLLLGSGDAMIEMHRYHWPSAPGTRRPCDTGFNHIAFYTSDIAAEFARLQAAGMKFFAEPQHIRFGDEAGHRWVWGADPFGTIIELYSPGDHEAGLAVGHPGLVVDDLDAAADWYCRMFGWSVRWNAGQAEIGGAALGLPDAVARVSRRVLHTGSADVELQKFVAPAGTASRRICDTGQGHIAVYAEDIWSTHERLQAAGMRFFAPPRDIVTDSELAGFTWTYGLDPWGNVVELIRHPPVPAA